ncbi:MAG: Vps62-related protein [Myxococcales bacterium]|nr:Vps62-related protein [Myxococcales bacterium]
MTPRLTLPLLLAACSAAPAEGTGEPATTTTATTTAATDPAPTSSPAPTTGDADGSADADATAAHTGDDDTTTTTTTTGEPTDTTDASSSTGEPPVDVRRDTLVTYAPRVWLHPGEQYFPSSVEFAFASMTRFPDGDGQHWIRSTEELASASDTLPFFAGDLAGAPVYAFWAEKAPDIVDLVYFFWYPYNRGKEVVDTIWGNHVGDWEHITVRLLRGPDDSLAPAQVYLSAHSFGGVYAWNDLERFADTHPVVYSAKGSHGVWSGPGDHVYMSIGEEVFDVCVTLVCVDLTDEAAPGTAWDTWHNVAGYDYTARQGLGGLEWPVWMSDDFTAPGTPPASQPGGGPIFRWGNEEDCTTLGVDISDLIGVCRLEDGPTGPVSKDVWGPELL